MSLFKTREWWRTRCGENETFDGHSMVIAQLFEADINSVIIIGSHEGYLRIYKPSSRWIEEDKNSSTGYESTDLIVESELGNPIIDLNVGKFVSGSQRLHLAILSPSKLTVYNVTRNGCNTGENDDGCLLSIAYEHNLKRLGATLTIGPFGGVNNRDFICVQCLDGTLLFYEQESFTLSYNLANYLLPNPLIYISKNDTFVTINSGWVLECYRYQHIAEFDKNKERECEIKRKLYPDWKYNLGESVIDIKIATLSSIEIGIVILGEKNLYCLKDNCTLKYTKRLEYVALCFHVYVIEPDGVLMVMTVTETNTLMMYEGTTLKWSAQLSFSPVSLNRGNFQHLDGVIVLLSEKGFLEGCFIGTEPSLFVAPPPSRTKDFNYGTVESEVTKYRRMFHKSTISDNSLTNATAESEINLTVSISPHLESCPFNENLKSEIDKHYMAKISIELMPYAPLRQVQVSVDIDEPLVVVPDFYEVANLCDRYVIVSMIYMNDKFLPASLETLVTVSYDNSFGGLRVLQKRVQTPIRLLMGICTPEINGGSFSMIVKTDEPVLNMSQLFPEFIGEGNLAGSNNAIGLRCFYTGTKVTIASATSSKRYRLQSEDNLAVGLIARHLIARLNNNYSKKQCTCASPTQLQLQILNTNIEAHFTSREEVKRIKEELELLATQLRNVEKKMVGNFKEISTRSLKSLIFLLDDTFERIFSLLEDLDRAQLERSRCENNLRRAIVSLLLLLETNVSCDKYALVESAIGFKPQPNNDIDWEEIADVSVSSVLRTRFKKSDNDKSKNNSELEPMKNVNKLKKRIAHLVERITKDINEYCDISAKLEDVVEIP